MWRGIEIGIFCDDFWWKKWEMSGFGVCDFWSEFYVLECGELCGWECENEIKKCFF